MTSTAQTIIKTPDLQFLHGLMRVCEELFALLEREKLSAWLDWGTLLGYQRHRNVIPWDYDADICMLTEDYLRLRNLFAQHGGTIGTLRLDPDYYGEADTCFGILGCDNPDLLIDIVSYRVEEGGVLHSMSDALVAEYPGAYDSTTDVIFPLRRGWFLGRQVLVPQQTEARLVEAYGEGWREYPEGYTDSDVTASPWQEILVHHSSQPDLSDSFALPQILRGVTCLDATHYQTVTALAQAQGGRWHKGSAGTDIVWVIPCAARNSLEVPAALTGLSFTDLVFSEERKLWGQIYVGALEEGDTLVLPDDCWVAACTQESGFSQ